EVRTLIQGFQKDCVFTELAAYRDGRCVTDRMMRIDRLMANHDLLEFCLHEVMQTPAGTYRRDLVLDVGGYSTSFWQSEDYEFHLRLAQSRPSFDVICNPLVNVRLRAEGRSQDRLRLHEDAVKALISHAPRLSATYGDDIAEAFMRRGSQLYQLGAKAVAEAAFENGYSWGTPKYLGKEMPYRLLAMSFGAGVAEECAMRYRKAVPEAIRRVLRGR